jgi:cytoskeletal protein CcmA (bactofilin family)
MAKQRSGAPAPPGQVNIIGQGTVIEGGLQANSDVRISGKVIGNVNVEGKTVITPEGVVEGEIRSSHADIAGRIEGEVFVQERLVLKDSAVVNGDIHTAKLVIEDGATFTGTCDMGSTLPKPGAKSPSSSKSSSSSSDKSSGSSSSEERGEGKRSDRPAASQA